MMTMTQTRTIRRSRPRLESLEGRALMTAGQLDPSFGGTGMVTTTFADSGQNPADAVVVQPDSKVVVAGGYNDIGSGGQAVVVRYNADGSLDSSFGNGGEVILPMIPNSYQERFYAAALQPDGKIVLAGAQDLAITTGTGKHKITTDYYDWEAVRLNADGSLDTSFGNGGRVVLAISTKPTNPATGIAIQPTDGKIVLAGQMYNAQTGGTFESGVIRLNPDGTTDTSFGSGGIVASPGLNLTGCYENGVPAAGTRPVRPDSRLL